ncbi:lactoylglutathione lyase [Ruegeria denitrificans]|uniref:Lactoylglutathione lyase n=1 Tax=Ruegeria denitrificans TaxID=1715692 RepID=A0A0P1IM11_9RHOB|nr:VOC family protein [Ruegeria denitrificans]CUK11797.1 lactoylglutathione lyase [Ruegeria denitrificans]
MRLSAVLLRVANPGQLTGFYTEVLGMTARAQGPNCRVGYVGQDADLLLMPGGGGYTHDGGQRYWKIGITVPDVDLAVSHLRAKGVEVSDPKQFLDIGYLCHLKDPEGFVVELLQHDFQGNRPENAADPADPFAKACIGQITLRTGDIAAEDAFCRAQGMRLLSVQDVAKYGFDLHFYAFTDDQPPNPDLWSVENREWLWKRPYTTLEFQHLAGAQFAPAPDYRGLEVQGLSASLRDAFGDPVRPG